MLFFLGSLPFQIPKELIWHAKKRNAKILLPISPPFVFLRSSCDYRRNFQTFVVIYALSFGSFIPIENSPLKVSWQPSTINKHVLHNILISETAKVSNLGKAFAF